MLAQIDTPDVDVEILLPFLFLAVGGLLLLTVASVVKDLPRWFVTAWSVTAASASAVSALVLWNRVLDEGSTSTLAGAVGFDGFSVFLSFVIAVAVLLALLLAHPWLEREEFGGVELHVLLLLSGAGGMIMAFANDLIVFFLGLETLSMAVYVLASMNRRRFQSQEAGMKYFVLGAFSSAFLLYGIALVYGATGTTNMVRIQAYLDSTVVLEDGLLLGGVALLIVGLAFKVGAAPFHTWTPDVYEGAPTPVVAYMASGVKAAGFAGLLRVMSVTFAPLVDDWGPPLEVIAALTLLVGAFTAIVQTDVKRMLAYSSISHAGFILLGVITATSRGTAAALFYLGSYTFLVVGTFGVLSVVAGRGDADFTFDSLKGLGRRMPLLSVAMLVFLLAQAGVPFTSGFFAKFNVVAAAVDAERYWVAAVAMLAAVVAAFLYIRIMISMYLEDPADDAATIVVPRSVGLVLAVSVAVTLLVGVVPGLLDGLATDAIAQLTLGG